MRLVGERCERAGRRVTHGGRVQENEPCVKDDESGGERASGGGVVEEGKRDGPPVVVPLAVGVDEVLEAR